MDFLEKVHYGLRVLKDFREGVLGKVFWEGLDRRKFGAEFSGSPGRVEGSRLSIRFLLSSWPCLWGDLIYGGEGIDWGNLAGNLGLVLLLLARRRDFKRFLSFLV